MSPALRKKAPPPHLSLDDVITDAWAQIEPAIEQRAVEDYEACKSGGPQSEERVTVPIREFRQRAIRQAVEQINAWAAAYLRK
jgi:hypothetical protein